MSFFRNLFGRRSEAAQPPRASEAAQPAAPLQPAVTAPAPAPVTPGSSAVATPAVPPEDCIALPLRLVTDQFPEELKSAIRKEPSEHVQVHIPRSLIRPQLASGAIRITYAQLRAAAPEIFFYPDAAPADAKVLLPLDYILRLMMPARREAQRQTALPSTIPSIFAKTEPAAATAAATRGTAEAWYTPRRPASEIAPPPTPEPVPAPAPIFASPPAAPILAAAPAISPTPTRIEIPRPPEPAPVPSVSPSEEVFALPLASVLNGLAPDIQAAFKSCDPHGAVFLIPLSELEPRMRTGKLLFKWSQLRSWTQAGLATPLAPDAEIELPLAPIVPLFIASRKTPSRKQFEIDPRIPEIFGKPKEPSQVAAPAAEEAAIPCEPAPDLKLAPVPAPAPSLAPAAAAPAIAPIPVPVTIAPAPAPVTVAPAPVPPAEAPAEEPTASPEPTPSTPAQIVQHIRSLPGVTGAFIATADGLLVAGEVPGGKENVLAAFAPTVFSQLTRYADMARLGQPQAVDVHLDAVTVHVRKAGRLFLGVLIPAGLPLPDLNRISTILQPQAS